MTEPNLIQGTQFKVWPAQQRPMELTRLLYRMANDRNIPEDEMIEWVARVLGESKYAKILTDEDCTEGVALATIVPRERWSEAHVGDLRVWVAPEYRSQGLGTQVVEWALYQAYHEGIRRVEAINYVSNTRARDWLARVGFVIEGVRKDAIRTESGLIDALVMALVMEEGK